MIATKFFPFMKKFTQKKFFATCVIEFLQSNDTIEDFEYEDLLFVCLFVWVAALPLLLKQGASEVKDTRLRRVKMIIFSYVHKYRL